VFESQGGKYAVCLGYFSKHPRIILSTRNMELYTWIRGDEIQLIIYSRLVLLDSKG
jgi:hypothetical protein